MFPLILGFMVERTFWRGTKNVKGKLQMVNVGIAMQVFIIKKLKQCTFILHGSGFRRDKIVAGSLINSKPLIGSCFVGSGVRDPAVKIIFSTSSPK
jgi:hypothetical protein